MPSNPIPIQRNTASPPTSPFAKPFGNGEGLQHRRAALSQKVSSASGDLTSVLLSSVDGTSLLTIPTADLLAWMPFLTLSSSNKRLGGRLRELTKELIRRSWRTPN